MDSRRSTVPDLDRVREVVRGHLPDPEYRVFLFGSRASGRARERSDWDIGILGPEDVPGHVMASIHDDLDELPTLHRFDLVDLHSVSETFRRQALKEVRPL